jgi:hypothetical protein
MFIRMSEYHPHPTFKTKWHATPAPEPIHDRHTPETTAELHSLLASTQTEQTQFPHGSQSSAPLPSSKQTSLPVPLTYHPANAPAKPNQANPRTHLPLACNLSAACLAFSRATLSSSSVAYNSASIAATSSSTGSAAACRMPDMASVPSG